MTASERLFLALDQGGHASRALVFDETGTRLSAGLATVDVAHPQPDWVEHDAERVVESLHAAMHQALEPLGDQAHRIACAGLATQRSSIVCWDRHNGAALSPVISWQDRRAQAWLFQFATRAERIQAITGLRLSPHYGASKLRWCLDHLPAVATAQRDGSLAFGPLASFLLARLLDGRPLYADPVNAARTLLWNLDSNNWDAELLALFGVPPAALPVCVANRHAFGSLLAAGHAVPLTLCTGDQAAALFSDGRPRPDSVYINLGTGAFAQRPCAGRPVAVPGLLRGIVFQNESESSYVLEGTVNGAGAALHWAADTLGLADLQQKLPAWLAEEGDVPLFLNGISGIGAPFWVPDFESRFIGEAENWRKAVAVAESIVFLLHVNISRMDTGSPIQRLVVTGGLAHIDGICRRLADLSGLSVYRPVETEATARGTACLLAGLPARWPEPAPGVTFRPSGNRSLHARYERWHAALRQALNE